MVLVGLVCVSPTSSNAPLPSVGLNGDELSLEISSPQATFEIGHTVPLHVELRNTTQKEIWVGFSSYSEELGHPELGVAANFAIEVRETSRRKVGPEFMLHESPYGKRQAQKWWVRLPPGFFYGRQLALTEYVSSFVKKPGRYQITVSYIGILPSNSDHGNSPPENANVFSGKIESNTVWVEMTSSTDSKR